MNQLESYSLLLSDSFFTNLAIDTSTELIVHTMKTFGNYNPILIIVIATIGFMLASIVNYFFGKIIFKVVAPSNKQKHTEMVDRTQSVRNSKLLPYILLISAIPFWGKFIILYSGFCNIRFSYMLSIVTLAKLAYYSYLIILS